MKLFPALPADLAAASDDELAQLRTAHIEAVTKIQAQDTEFLGELSAADIVKDLNDGVDQLAAITAELTARSDAQKNFSDEVAQLAARAAELAAENEAPAEEPAAEEVEVEETETETETETEAEVAEPVVELETKVEAVEEVEAVAAAATKRLARPPAATRQHRPQPTSAHGAKLVASAGIRGFTAGEELNLNRLGDLLQEGARQFTARSGVEERVVLASAQFDYPEERSLCRPATATATWRRSGRSRHRPRSSPLAACAHR
jgi:ABC-type transporter Mla subunit MlaD